MSVNAWRPLMVMTGGTGGFGSYALERFVSGSDIDVVLGARGTDRKVPGGVEVRALDMASLGSVRSFAEAVIGSLAERRIDYLVLNAGTRVSATGKTSADGFELTFAVNHLAHYLLCRLLLPYMSKGGRIVITSSNMHDPPMKSLAPIGMDPDRLASPEKGDGRSGVRAYCASKLANIMTALFLANMEEVKERGVDVVAFNPGLTGGSSGSDATRAQRFWVALMMQTVFRLVGLFRKEFIMNPPEHAGEMFAGVVLGNTRPPGGKYYVSLVLGEPTFPDPSELARDPISQHRLWVASARMVGLPIAQA